MKPTRVPEQLQWSGIDLHVHTPASYDYEGSRDESEYLTLVRSANEFALQGEHIDQTERKQLISCIAFTDHNSVEGFCKWRKTVDDTTSLAAAVKSRDPKNELVRRLESDLEVLRSVRILMGVEINANPGVHLLLVFHESIQPDAVRSFLSEAYGKTYEEFAGDSGLITVQTLEETLDTIHQRFGDKVIVIAPHIENKGGIHEALKELAQLRMMALRHPALTALSFNKPETRERLRELMRQGDYKRSTPLAFIQSSDAHGKRGRIGQPRTDVNVPHGRPTFTNIRDALCHGRVKCSVDFVEEEYNRLTSGEAVFKYKATEPFGFQEQDHDQLATHVCAILNSRTGIIELEGIRPEEEETNLQEKMEEHMRAIVRPRVSPMPLIILTLEFRWSPSRVKMIFKPLSLRRLASREGTVFVLDSGSVRAASSNEIETIVAQNIEKRFGDRFTDALEDISSRSILLSRMPAAIPMLLRCRERFEYLDEDDIKLRRVESPVRGKLDSLEFMDLMSDLTDKTLFGSPSGSCVVIDGRSTPPREKEHYVRYLPFRFDCSTAILEKFGSSKLEIPSILVRHGGCTHYSEASLLVCESDVFSLNLDCDPKFLLALVAWLKSSFFVWYTAVHLGNVDLYRHLQNGKFSFPIPVRENKDLYSRLSMLAENILHEERRFLTEFNREMQRGIDDRHRERLRTRHNSMANGISLSIDKEIYDFLKLSRSDQRFISETLKDLEMYDFGLLESLKESGRGTSA